MKNAIWSEGTRGSSSFMSLTLPVLSAMAALVIGLSIGRLGTHALGLMLCILAFAILTILRQDQLLAVGVIAVGVYFDWYLGVHVVSLLMTVALLCVFYVARSGQRPWVAPRAQWLWVLFLGLAIYPAIQGALTSRDALIYYPGVVFGALIAFWLGNVVARNPASVRLLFRILAGFGVLIAVHLIVQNVTGTTLLGSSGADAYLAQVNNYQLNGDSGISRVGSFFVNPDFAGIFFAMLIFIPIGLYAESSSFSGRFLYLAEAVIMLPALLFTFSASSWLAVGAGLVVLVILIGSKRSRIQLLIPVAVGAVVLLIGFSPQLSLLIKHASDPVGASARQALWQSAVRAIQAHPFTGVGLGHLAYQMRADAFYHLPEQLRAYDHPHNSYLELGAMAGLPVLIVFLALLTSALRHAWRNWRHADAETRALLGAGTAAVVALSFNSWFNEGWTLPPLAALGWLILGIIGSPLLRQTPRDGREREAGLQARTGA
jgi:O-antigen ligase